MTARKKEFVDRMLESLTIKGLLSIPTSYLQPSPFVVRFPLSVSISCPFSFFLDLFLFVVPCPVCFLFNVPLFVPFQLFFLHLLCLFLFFCLPSCLHKALQSHSEAVVDMQ